MSQYQLHPGVIEACFQVLRCCREFESARLFKETGDVYVPFSIERFRFHRRPESHRLWCHATIREPARRDGQNVTGDLCLCDENGNLVAEIIGFEQRKLKKDILLRHLARDPSEWLYQLGWKTATLPERPAAETGGTPGTWLVFSDEAGVGRELASLLIDRGDRTVLVSAGSTYERIDAFNYCLDSDAPDQLRRLLDDCTQEHGRPDKGVVYLWGLAGAREEELSLDSLQQAQGVSYGGGLSLVQAMASELWSPNPRIWLVTRGTQPVGQDETRDLVNAPLWGLGRVVALEHPELGCTMLDLPPAVSVPDDAQCLFDELVSASREDQIAYRDGVRSAARLVRHSPTTPVRGQCPVHRDATYLVTGGLGGLGLEVAKWLVASGARHLLLVGRRAPSEPAARMIEAMEQAGAKMTTASVDISREHEVRSLLGQVEAGAPLRGIIHAAGVLDDGVLLQQDRERFERVMAPKVAGAWNLHRLTRRVPLDFFVSFSSAASILGAVGQGNYAAANAFLDALAHYRHSLGLAGSSINWGPWGSVGMAAALDDRSQERMTRLGWQAIAPAQGVQILGQLLKGREVQAAVLPITWPVFVEGMFGGHVPPPVFDEVSREARPDADPFVATKQDHSIVERLKGIAEVDRRPLLVTHVRQTVAGVLGIDTKQTPLSAQQGFVDMGMDSLMGVELRRILQESIGVPLASTFALDYPNIDDVVDYLVEHLASPCDNGAAVKEPSTEDNKKPAEETSHLGQEDEAMDDSIEQELARLEASLEVTREGNK